MMGKTPDNHQQPSGTCWEIGGFGWGKKLAEIREKLQKNPQISLNIPPKSL